MVPANPFPEAFSCYKPFTEKVYGSVCLSPQNRVLVVKGRKHGKWSFPKGHKLRNETYLDCAVRETWEETGLNLRGRLPIKSQKLAEGEYFFYEFDEEPTLTPVDTAEVEYAAWLPIDALHRRQCNVDVNNFVNRLRRHLRREAAAAATEFETIEEPQLVEVSSG